MYRYSDNLTLNSNFSKSTNIIYDRANCDNYIVTTSSKNVLKVFFDSVSENSIALIGSFGCGKSSFLLYINSILSNRSKCVEKLKNSDEKLYEKYKAHSNKNYFHLKIVGESISFKTKLKNEILNLPSLENSCDYLTKNSDYQLTTLLKKIDLDIEKSEFDSLLFSIDEFGKFIDFAIESCDSFVTYLLRTVEATSIESDNVISVIASILKLPDIYAEAITTTAIKTNLRYLLCTCNNICLIATLTA